MVAKFLSIALLSPLFLFSRVDVQSPWFTGSLICPSPHTIPQGHFNLEPYIFYDNIVGAYDHSWQFHSANPVVANLNFQEYIQMGVIPGMDLTIVPQFFYNLTNDPKNPWSFGDLGMKIGIQLLNGSPIGGIPSIKLSLGEVFPLGKYQFLDDNSGGTDAFGGGAFGTSISLTGGRLFRFSNENYLATRADLGTVVFSGVSLHGTNAYGGDASTEGVLHPGALFNFIVAAEYSITRNLVLALDVVNVYTLKSTFHGTSNKQVGNRSNSYQLSFAPALEWNFNANVGLIGGVWLTAIGANSGAFINGVLALNWYI